MPKVSQEPRAKRIIIGITGHIGAGKTTAGKYLSSRHGFRYVRYSQVLSEWLAKDPESKARLQEIGWEVMAKGLQAELNRRLLAKIQPNANIVVEGLRHPLDYESLKKSFASSFHLLFIESPQRQRWARKKTKNKYASLASFQAADSHPVEKQINSLRGNAALILRNKGLIRDLHVALDKAVLGFRPKGDL